MIKFLESFQSHVDLTNYPNMQKETAGFKSKVKYLKTCVI